MSKFIVVESTKCVHVQFGDEDYIRSEGILSTGEKFVDWHILFKPNSNKLRLGSYEKAFLEDVYQKFIVVKKEQK